MHHGGACYSKTRARRLAAENTHTHTRTPLPGRIRGKCFQSRFPTGVEMSWAQRSAAQPRAIHSLHTHTLSPTPPHPPLFPRLAFLIGCLVVVGGASGPGRSNRIENGASSSYHNRTICIIPLRGPFVCLSCGEPTHQPACLASGCGTYMTRSVVCGVPKGCWCRACITSRPLA
ncbi:hypothetical protein BC826DRAFT_260222 [Russula brevipes]|nr:hypothetical protein BC826DRAFT_260222 [Russula brevipes]